MALPEQLKLEVATPVGRSLDIESTSVQIPGNAGEFGILPGHLPILASVKPGILKYAEGGQTKFAAIGAGFAEADEAKIRLIVEFFVTSDKVDAGRAKTDLENAEKRLKEFKGELGDPEHVEANRDLDWARARLELAASTKN